MTGGHRLQGRDLLALGNAEPDSALIHRISAAQRSRRRLLVEAVRRRSSSSEATRKYWRAFGEALAADGSDSALWRLPQLGVWAARGLRAEPDLHQLVTLAARTRSVPRVRVESDGCVLELALDHDDPCLDGFDTRVDVLTQADVELWRQRLGEAWRLLVGHHRERAEGIAAALTTIVPLRPGANGELVSATSGWAYGAVALSLPQDALAGAEALIHEAQHTVLGGVMDLVPLLADEPDDLAYVPWREDPRPVSGRLHGSFAYLGLLDFWARLAARGPEALRELARLKTGRWLAPTRDALDALTRSDATTEAGAFLVTTIAKRIHAWPDPTDVPAAVLDAALEHRLRWRLRNLWPDRDAVEAVARCWATQAPVPVPAERLRGAPAHRIPLGPRCLALEAASGDGHSAPAVLDMADVAVLDGRYADGATGYVQRIRADKDDLDAWVGLALCRTRLLQTGPLTERPELVAAVHARLRSQTAEPPGPDAVARWLAQTAIGSMSRLARPR